MAPRIHRRAALRRLAVLSLSAIAPAGLAACSKKPSCGDVSGLSTDDLVQRNVVARYTEDAIDPTRRCALCVQFLPGPPNACGGCKIVKGPINPEGNCKLFAPKAV